MHLDRKHEEELRRRKGTARRTILQFTWLLISLAAAYFLAAWLFEAGHLSYDFFYTDLALPRAVPNGVILATVTIVFLILIQFTVMLGFLFGNREGRSKSGMPSAQSKHADPFESDRGQW